MKFICKHHFLAPLADCFEHSSNLRQLSGRAYSIAGAPAYAPCLQPSCSCKNLERRVSIIFAMRQAFALIQYITLITEHKNVLATQIVGQPLTL